MAGWNLWLNIVHDPSRAGAQRDQKGLELEASSCVPVYTPEGNSSLDLFAQTLESPKSPIQGVRDFTTLVYPCQGWGGVSPGVGGQS